MKRVSLLFAALLLCFGAQAQIVSSSSRTITTTVTPKAPSTTTHYMRLGLNFMNYVGDGAEGLDGKLGYDFTFGFQKPIGTSGLYWGMEYGLGSRGAGYSDDEEDFSIMCHNIHYSPFQIGFKYNISGKWSVDPHLGVYLSADYTGKMKSEYEDYYGEKGKEEASMSDWEDYNRVDVGMRFGVGVWYDRFNLDLTYQRGFLESFDETKSSNLMLRLGVAF